MKSVLEEFHKVLTVGADSGGGSIRAALVAFGGEITPGARVLDVGCGLRPYEDIFKHCKYLGIDVESSGRQLEQKKPDLYFDGVAIPFDDASFDALICTEVLEHCVEPERLLAECHRVLRRGGQVFLTVPFMWGVHEAPYDFRRYSIFGLNRAFAAAGFEVTQIGRLDSGQVAIERIVRSEITNYLNTLRAREGSDKPLGLRWKFLAFLGSALWKIVRWTWSKTYNFERIYIDNIVRARKP